MKSNTTLVITILIGSIICIVLGACLTCGTASMIGFSISDLAGDGISNPGTSNGAIATGEIAPDFSLENLDGEWVSLSQFRGQPVLINFWSTWCGPCVDEIPAIRSSFQQHYPNLVVLAIESDTSRNDLIEFSRDKDIPYPILLGSDSITRQYRIQAYPTSFFVDADGVIQSVVIGGMSTADLDRELAKIGLGD